jgi:hypothetical protein
MMSRRQLLTWFGASTVGWWVAPTCEAKPRKRNTGAYGDRYSDSYISGVIHG